ncbi:endonuclease/exonuclease/phosphatase family protein [Streptomyces sp. MZ04]|uniref:endonuclease/exonuclease/phosphatase family protein n=1 Tax=Streptomyces sp. MZ04 TaxID=2559236 RepID=UPI00107EC38F|nr:endonuclease/exonuclease/phosphatase family protein [Streptomyces sp. MZ04]TGB15828.1 endonuclease/exonuclease/phosphatase family protein [Streptomyces sp. MZ04]
MQQMESGTASQARRPDSRAWLRRPAWPRWGTDAAGRSPWTRGRVLAALAVLTAGLLAFPSAVPNTVGRAGSLLETFLPWLGLAVPLLFLLALLRRSATALLALLLPAAVWGGLFGGLLFPEDRGAHDITAVQHNVSDVNADPAGTALALIEAEPELVALEELTPSALPVYERVLAPTYPYRAIEGTVGLWSKYPLSDVRPLDIRPKGIGEGWQRGMRARMRAPQGDVAVYVAHLPSVRLGLSGFGSGRRDESAGLLGAALAAERLDRVILLGDLNSTADDRGLDPVTSRMEPVERDFAFSWPEAFPVSRIDHVMTRAATVTHIRTLPATGSDHLPIAADIKLRSP